MGSHQHDHNEEEFDGFSLQEIKKRFSALGEEIEEGGHSISEIVNQSQNQQVSDHSTPYFRGYNPTIKDFLARANTVEECLEIIEYCLEKGDITPDEADTLRTRLDQGGPRAFGTRKPGYYDQHL